MSDEHQMKDSLARGFFKPLFLVLAMRFFLALVIQFDAEVL